MKTKNLVLCVLILLLGLVSIAAGYLLYAKRAELTDGWNKMTTAINRSSTELDRNSGSKYAESLSAEEMAPFRYATLDKSLAKYQEQVKKVAANRNKLVAALAGIALKSNLTGITEEDLRKVDASESNSAKVVKAFEDSMAQRDGNFKKIISLSKSDLGATLSMDDLVAGKADAFAPAENAVTAIRNRNRVYEGKLKDVSVMVEVPASFGEDYQVSTRNIAEAVDRLRATDNALKAQLEELNQSNSSIRQSIAADSAAMVEIDRDIAARKEAAKSYKARLGIAENADPLPWEDGSKESRAALIGRIIKVKADYGYIAVDLGYDTVVRQPMGKGFVAVNPKIVKGTNVLIYRGSGKASRTVARLVLNEVGANVSTANITSETPELKVGDLVRCEFIN